MPPLKTMLSLTTRNDRRRYSPSTIHEPLAYKNTLVDHGWILYILHHDRFSLFQCNALFGRGTSFKEYTYFHFLSHLSTYSPLFLFTPIRYFPFSYSVLSDSNISWRPRKVILHLFSPGHLLEKPLQRSRKRGVNYRMCYCGSRN